MSEHARPKKQKPQALSPSREGSTASPRSSGRPEKSPSAGTDVPATRPVPEVGPSPTHHQIAVRAYQIWEDKGRPDGSDREDWFEAERLLRAAAQ
jgi:hypothetical protein